MEMQIFHLYSVCERFKYIGLAEHFDMLIETKISCTSISEKYKLV